MEEVKKLGVLSVAKIAGLFGLVLGILSIILTQVVCKISAGNPEIAQLAALQMQCGAFDILGSLVGVIFIGVIYFVGGAVSALLYNLFVRWVGGVQVELGAPKVRKKK